MSNSYSLNIRRLLTDLGGPTRVVERLQEMGIPVTLGAVKKWRERNSMDSVYLVNLIAHAAHFEAPGIDVRQYITRGSARLPRAPRSAASARSGTQARRGAPC